MANCLKKTVLFSQVLGAVHLYDNVYPAYNRDWREICDLAGGGVTVEDAKAIFKKLSVVAETSSTIKVKNTQCERIQRTQFSEEDCRRKEKDLLEAMSFVSPQTLFSWTCIHFLGYALRPVGNEEPLAVFFSRFEKLRVELSQDQQSKYERYMITSSNIRSTNRGPLIELGYITDEMNALWCLFEQRRTGETSNVLANERGCNLRDIAYYKRNVVNGRGKVVGIIMSDVELFTIYTWIYNSRFNFEQATELEWEKFLNDSKILPVGKTAKEAKMEMICYCFPRIPLLLSRLGFGMNLGHIQFRHYTQVGIKIIYHSLKEATMAGIFKTLRDMQQTGVLVSDAEFGIHVLPWIFAQTLLRGKADFFYSTNRELNELKRNVGRDILQNYCLFTLDLFETTKFAVKS